MRATALIALAALATGLAGCAERDPSHSTGPTSNGVTLVGRTPEGCALYRVDVGQALIVVCLTANGGHSVAIS